MLTDAYWTELGHRAVAAGWKWAPGAADTTGQRVVAVWRHDGGTESIWFADDTHVCDPEDLLREHHPRTDLIPDFRDAATKGILLALVREATGDPSASVWRARGEPPYWEVSDCPASLPCVGYGMGPTEVEALLAALEAAST